MPDVRSGTPPAPGFPDPPAEPVAIVGIGCRFPGGANDPQSYWRLIESGVDAISEIPGDRFRVEKFYDSDPANAGTTTARWGGFVSPIDRFDAGFFGLSPREAEYMDPQQRLLLETSWEALEDGGLAIDPKVGARAGVFVGISTNDYSLAQFSTLDGHDIDMYTPTGGAMSIAANRLSFLYNFNGPSLSVDTACSSSLVSVHLACRSLWHDECDFALAAGVNCTLTPNTWLGFSRMSMLSPDGRCKPFDARANGFVRSEGAGVLVLKRLSQAQADGDRIYALIRGTAVNQDGAASAGMTMPARCSQEEVIRSACRVAGIDPGQLAYIEAHGTGTAVGDPIEASAIGATVGQSRTDDSPVLLGSVKSNIGHLESGAGIAGLTKATLALYHRTVPPSLHFETPNPNIDFDGLNVRVPTEAVRFDSADGALFAGVNSFGFGGTNAHVVIESPPAATCAGSHGSVAHHPGGNGCHENGNGRHAADEPAANGANGGSAQAHGALELELEQTEILPLSAKSAEALMAQAKQLRDALDAGGSVNGSSWRDVCHTMAARRHQHREHRAAVVARDRAEAVACLRAVVDGELHPAWCGDDDAAGVAVDADTRPVFVFCGQGPQWHAMGRELLASDDAFRAKMAECDALIRQLGDWSLLEELSKDEESSRIHDTSIGQPAIFAIQVALAARWKSWGIEPAAVVGHSVGEVAAAHLAGALTLEQAVRVIFHRGRCMAKAGEGAMLAVGLSPDEAEALLAGRDDGVCLAAANGPNSVTLAGVADELEAIGRELDERGIFQKPLRVRYAFHSSQMDPIRDELLESLAGLTPGEATLPLYSTVAGEAVPGSHFDADYWWHNVRQPVRFHDAIDALAKSGHRLFLELGPHPALTSSIAETLRARGDQGRVVASLRRNEDERATLLKALGDLHVAGLQPDWQAVCPGRLVALPTYPWQRDAFWAESEDHRQYRLAERAHPLLGRERDDAEPSWTNRLGTRARTLIDDHRVQGRTVFPAAGYLEMALEAARQTLGDVPCDLTGVDFLKAWFLPPAEEPSRLRLLHEPDEGTFRLYASLAGGAGWALHCRGEIHEVPESLHAAPVHELAGQDGDDPHLPGGEVVPVEDCYQQFRQVDLDYGPRFQGLVHVERRGGEALGRVVLPEAAAFPDDALRLHPALLDACFQTLILAATPEDRSETPTVVFLPTRIERLRLYQPAGDEVFSHVRLEVQTPDVLVGTLTLFDRGGTVVADIEGFTCRAAGAASGDRRQDWLYEQVLESRPLPEREFACRPSDYLPPIEAIVERIRARAAADTAHEPWGEIFRRHLPAIQHLCRVYVEQGLAELGWNPAEGERRTTAELVDQLGVVAGREKILQRLLGILAEDGLLEADGEHWIAKPRDGDREDPELLWRTALRSFPAYHIEFRLLRRFGRELAGILSGDTDPLSLLFAHESQLAESLYSDGFTVRRCNAMLCEGVSAALERLPRGRRIRILEIGAGTGGMTAGVLPALDSEQVSYVYTDVSAHFLSKAEQRFADSPFIEYRTLDIESSPLDQGFDTASFDLVLAANVLHATSDLHRTLRNVREILAPGGLMLLLELGNVPRTLDLTFGLVDGWWKMEDERAESLSPLLDGASWERLLATEGFEKPISTEADDGTETVVLARAPLVDSDSDADSFTTAIPAPDAESDAAWLLLADRGGLASSAAARLRDAGHRCVLVHASESAPATGSNGASPDDHHLGIDDEAGLRSLIASLPSVQGVIHAWSLDLEEPEGADAAANLAAAEGNLLSVVNLVRAIAAREDGATTRLWLLTRGAQFEGGDDANPVALAQAPLIGLARTLINEQPTLRCRTIDLDPRADRSHDRQDDALLAELFADDGEREVVLRGEGRYGSRLVRTTVAKTRREWVDTAGEGVAFALDTTQPGVLDRLAFRPVPRREPGPGEIEIEVCSAALNFRDVMKALGIYPTEGDDSLALGDECAGRVTAVGEGVDGLAVGDEVLTIAQGCFASHVTTPASYTFRKPEAMSFDEAVTVPITFLTAAYALEHLAGIREGERVLIHAATGGVGLAAIQIARLAGAEIFATAGSPEKREFLRAIGIEHVLDSRTLAFADEIRELTDGEGVDIVLNSLAGEAIPKSLDLLRDYGRFLEIGKRDIYQNSRIGLRAFRKNLSYHAIDLSRTMIDRVPLVRSILGDLMQRFESGALAPMPHLVLPHSQVVGAFRTMREAKHIGKVVLSFDRGRVPLEVEQVPNDSPLVTSGTALVTGGLSGFGLETARWLADRGVASLALMSRSGAATDEARDTIAQLRERGVAVLEVRGDVSSRDNVAAAFDQIDAAGMPPLGGIVHAAMVLDDANLLDHDAERLHRVMAPKVQGGWHLHQLAAERGLDLDFFLVYSSFSALVGTPGQANYAAANVFMEALVHHRIAAGGSGFAVNWGHIGETGFVARNDQVAEGLNRMGLLETPPRPGLNLAEALIRHGHSQAAITRLDWRLMGLYFKGLGASGRYQHLLAEVESDEADHESSRVRERILCASEAEQGKIMLDYLRNLLARVLRTSAAKLDIGRPLTELGLDSLMAVELINRMEADLSIGVPTGQIAGQSIRGLSESVLPLVTGKAQPAAKTRADRGAPGTDATANSAGTEIESAEDRELTEAVGQLEAMDDEALDDMIDELLEGSLTGEDVDSRS